MRPVDWRPKRVNFVFHYAHIPCLTWPLVPSLILWDFLHFAEIFAFRVASGAQVLVRIAIERMFGRGLRNGHEDPRPSLSTEHFSDPPIRSASHFFVPALLRFCV